MISENLLTLRKRSGYSQEYVAEKIGVSRQAVAKWENGETTPDLPNTMALAQLYDVLIDDLVNYQSGSQLPLPRKGKYAFGMVTVGEKGQIVIPARCRKIFDIKPGDTLLVLGDTDRGIALVNQHFLMDVIEQVKMPGLEELP